MPVTNYITVNGQLTGEITNGVRTQYMTDALGSVIGTTDGSGNILNTYRYTPYGGKTYKTGTSPDPKFLFAGTWGGRQTGRAHSEEYWRARHRSEPETTWTTVDPLWPTEDVYGYAMSSPTTRLDQTGLSCKENCSDYLSSSDVRKLGTSASCVLKCSNGDWSCVSKCLGAAPWNDLIDYLICEWASKSLGGTHGKNPCCSPTDNNCYQCCNFQYQACNAKCYNSKNELDFGLCEAKCWGRDDWEGRNCCYETCDGVRGCKPKPCK